MGTSFGEVLSQFKAKENPLQIGPLLENDFSLINGLAAWSSVPVIIRPKGECEEKSELEKWNWLWDCCEINLDDFSSVSNTNPQNAEKLFKRLKGLRLIYPDGTCNKISEQFVTSLVVSKLPKRKPNKD